MKRITSIFVAAAIVVLSPQVSVGVQAADVVTDAQIAAIRTHCTEIQSVLARLSDADTSLRVNRGNLYDDVILKKLMIPLNQRISANQLDGSELVKITAEYSQMYGEFRQSYFVYNTALEKVRGIDCTKQQVGFYDALTDASDKRQFLAEKNASLVRLISQYQEEFAKFKASTLSSDEEVNT